tara:strand:+ start:6179 stop:7726 length:1548 start_codon:yes stop_codon:yes gene_type:complete
MGRGRIIMAENNPDLETLLLLQAQQKVINNQQSGPALNPNTGMPEGYFIDPRTGQAVNRDALSKKPSSLLEKIALPAGQGQFLGYSDELFGLLNQFNPFMKGTKDQKKQFGTEYARARQEATRRDAPVVSTASEIGGAILSPLAKFGQAKTLLGQVAKSVPLGAIGAGIYGSGTAEGNVDQRVEEGLDAAPYGAVFGFISPVVVNSIGKLGNTTYKTLFNRSVKKPTVKNLLDLKNFAYNKLETSGHTFSGKEIDNLALRIMSVMDEVDYSPEEKHIQSAINLFNRQTVGEGKKLTLPQVDKLRQRLYSIYQKGFDGSNQYDPRIYEMIEQVDDMIASHGDASTLYKAAREAHGRYKKSQLIEDAFERAERQTARSGSGGNILNNYKAAVNRILNSKQKKYFTKDEIEVMDKMVRGDVDQQMLRLAGKVSPSGNGLMLMLNGLAVFQNPGFLAMSLGGAAAKKSAENIQKKDILDLENYIATGIKPKIKRKSGFAPLAASAVANQSKEINKKERY